MLSTDTKMRFNDVIRLQMTIKDFSLCTHAHYGQGYSCKKSVKQLSLSFLLFVGAKSLGAIRLRGKTQTAVT